jgi:hypothetical protein
MNVAQRSGEADPQLDWCKDYKLSGGSRPRDALGNCEAVVVRLYVAYLRTGDDKYFNQALGFFNYVWNWTEQPGIAFAGEHDNMVGLLTDACRQRYPEYGDTIP